MKTLKSLVVRRPVSAPDARKMSVKLGSIKYQCDECGTPVDVLHPQEAPGSALLEPCGHTVSLLVS